MNEERIKRSAAKIKAKLADAGYFTIKAAAEAINQDADHVSQTINYLRPNEGIRRALAGLIGQPVGKVFDTSIICVPAAARSKAA